MMACEMAVGNSHLPRFRDNHYDGLMRQGSERVLPVIAVDRGSETPLHRQVYDGFRSAILRGDLRPGQRVPSSRDLAAELRISRLPVLNAYAQLMAEGYFESRAGAGTFVAGDLPESLTSCRRPTSRPAEARSGPRPAARRAALYPSYERFPWARGWGAFGLHQPALEHFPFHIWASLVARHSLSPRVTALHRFDPLGSEPFREAICEYLRTSRAVRCDPRQVIIVSGSQQALDISARVLLDPGNTVWVEEPGYWLARNLLTGAGCRLAPVPVDEEGLDVATGVKLARAARVAYVTPSHQFPLGATMSLRRRLELLNWAQRSGSWIIEDDYDSEYRYESMPVASLQGLDSNSRVVYIGTFSKVLFPSLRLGYIVIPSDLVGRFVAVRYATDIFPPYLTQEAMADFMREGHFARHIRRTRLLYRERRTALVENLAREFGDRLEVHGAEAGMHLVVTLPERLNDTEVAVNAAAAGLWLWPLSTAYAAEPRRHGFILAFGSTTPAEMPGAVRRLRAALRL